MEPIRCVTVRELRETVEILWANCDRNSPAMIKLFARLKSLIFDFSEPDIGLCPGCGNEQLTVVTKCKYCCYTTKAT